MSSSDARKLESIQAALDAHAEGCGDPVRAIRLNPWEAEQLDWWEFRGLPIEPDPRLPTGMVKVDCLAVTVREAIEDFHSTMAEDRDLADAEARLRSKLDQLAALMDDWWQPVRDPEWWRRVAQHEPELYRRFLRGDDWDLMDHVRAEAAQLGGGLDDPEQTFQAWQDAWDDMDAEDQSMMLDALTDMPDDVLEGVDLVPRAEDMPRVLRPPKERVKVPLWYRFWRWLTGKRPNRPKRLGPANKSSIRTALDRYGRSGR